jgi:hypothetical protein
MFGAVAVPRVAAALVLASLTLLAVGVMRARIGGPTDRSHTVPIEGTDPTVVHWTAPSSAFQTTRFETPAGRSDATDSFSPSLRPGEKDSLRRYLRGH